MLVFVLGELTKVVIPNPPSNLAQFGKNEFVTSSWSEAGEDFKQWSKPKLALCLLDCGIEVVNGGECGATVVEVRIPLD